MKLITKINEKISVVGDGRQYAVKIQRSQNSKPEHWYVSSLDSCFLEVFEYLCREKLADGKDKSLKEVAQIILDTKEEILKIMAPFVELTTKK